jgi:hypothetical protein
MVNVKIKTFCGIRKTFTLDIGITETIEFLRDLLLTVDDTQELAKYKQIRFLYPSVRSSLLPLGQINRVVGVGDDSGLRAAAGGSVGGIGCEDICVGWRPQG